MWSFVGNKNNKQWLWLSIDIETKEIVGFYLGERGEKGAAKIMEFITGCLKAVCSLLYRFLVSLRACLS